MTIELWQLVLALAVFLGGCLATAWRVGWVVASYIAKINEQMADMKAEFVAMLDLKERSKLKFIKHCIFFFGCHFSVNHEIMFFNAIRIKMVS